MNNIIFKLVFLLACVLVAFAINSCSQEEDFGANAKNSIEQIDFQNVMKHDEIAQKMLSSELYEGYISSAILLYENLNFSYNNQDLISLKTEKQLQDWMIKNWKNTNFISISEFESSLRQFKIYQEEFTNLYSRNLLINSSQANRKSFNNTVLAILQKKDSKENNKIALSYCRNQALNEVKKAKNNAIISLITLNSTVDKDQDLENLFAVFLVYNEAVSKSSEALNNCFKLEQVVK